MNRITRLAIFSAILALTLAPGAFSADDSIEAGNRALAKAFEKAWNDHDMNVAFRKLLTDDVVWVSVSGGKINPGGIQQVVSGHARVHEGVKFKDSVMTIKEVAVSPLRADLALVQVTWHMEGDRDNDGTARPPRDGIFMWVTEKFGETWKIRASQNTNTTPIK